MFPESGEPDMEALAVLSRAMGPKMEFDSAVRREAPVLGRLCGTSDARNFVASITTNRGSDRMPWTTKLLVIANRTIDSDELCEAIISRAAAGPVQVTLVAPASSGAGSHQERHAATVQRLDRALQRLRDAGVPVEGMVGDADPMVAVQDAWNPRRFDEVLVATLPTGTSRWLAADLPHRVERFTGARVTHIVAAGDHARSAS